jgi:hypothetical protein
MLLLCCAVLLLPFAARGPHVVPAALTSACRRGRVDVIVQSTDKNFMVPVGGAVITAPSGIGRGWLVDAVARGYPGRAAMTPLLDLLTTLLYWGVAGWKQQLQQREELYVYLRWELGVEDSNVSAAVWFVCSPCCVGGWQGGGRGWLVDAVAKVYPGRAAMTSWVDSPAGFTDYAAVLGGGGIEAAAAATGGAVCVPQVGVCVLG